MTQFGCNPCGKSELDLESVPFTQVAIADDYWLTTGPKSALDNSGPLEFVISSSGDDYLDLNELYVRMRLRIAHLDKSPIKHFEYTGDRENIDTTQGRCDQVSVAPVNLAFHSLWKQVDFIINDVLVSSSQDTYSYRALLSTLLSYSNNVKSTWLKHMEGFRWDDPGKYDSAENSALDWGAKYQALNGNVFELKSKLHIDMTLQDRLLPNGTEVKIVLTRSNPEFFLMSFEPSAKPYTVILEAASVDVRRVKLAPEEQIRLEKVISTHGATYPVNHVITKSFTVSSGTSTIELDNVFTGQLPSKVFLGLVKNAAFHGSYSLNPYNFVRAGLTFACLNVDGKQVPSRGYECDFHRGSFIDAFHGLHKNCGSYGANWSNGIDRAQFIGGCFILGFDLTPDESGNGGAHVTQRRLGCVKASLRFEKALTSTMSVIFMAEFDNTVYLDRNRSVTYDYTL